jgi:hypothetical protein
VERWRPGDERPEILTEVMRWVPAAAVEPWEIELAGFFRRVLGEV